ncbi:glycoside hydrolase family 13 protein [Ferruginibacter sp.]|nr:glycoside hydrolase family 13 protein [Ferruginibacter sp.]
MLPKKLFFVILALCLKSIAAAQINHVEPLNWWIGMKNPNLQLLINGVDIGATTPVINYTGVTIKKINKADSKNYLFIDLVIAKNTKPGTVIINFKKEGKIVYTYNYNLLARQTGAAQLKGFNSSDAIYLITPDRFVNGDYSNDVVKGMREDKINRSFEGARHGGDIRGIINNLDYIKDMGFTAIWPTPLLENDMPSYSYHGYAITNHYKVDPRFGTLDEYKELSAKANQKGIKLIFDGVINHTGSYYWWMNDLPFKNWLNYQDSSRPTNHRRTVNQDLYAANYDKEIMKKGWFDKMMPDMNGQNPFMANYLIQNSIWWIETLQLGGIRQDTYCYSDKDFAKNWSCSIMNEYPNFSLVGEEWSLNPLITSYWQTGKQNRDGYTSCLTNIMDFPLQDALVLALKDKETNKYEQGMTKLYEALANDFEYANPGNILVMGDNHDMDRIYTQLDKDAALTQMALTYLLTVRGIPQIYYGTEVLMDNTGHHKNDGLIRSDFPGGWKGDSANAFNTTGLSVDQIQMQAFLKKILTWRKNASAIHNGKTLHFAPFNKTYVYFRYNNKQLIMVLLNKNETATTIDTRRFAEILVNKTKGINILTGENIDIQSAVTIPPKTALVLEIK